MKPPALRTGPGMMKAMAWFMSAMGKVFPVPENLSGESIRIVAGTTYVGDNAKAKRELGFDPRPLREGLAEALRWEMAQLGKRG